MRGVGFSATYLDLTDEIWKGDYPLTSGSIGEARAKAAIGGSVVHRE
jgi:hypothetical protein